MSVYGVKSTRIACEGDGRTKQSMKDECDINLIVAKYDRTGLLDHLADGVPHYADVSEVGDYRTALDTVREAQEYFDGFPAKVRAEFDHDVTRFMTYLEDASESDVRTLGLEVLERRANAPRMARFDREGEVEPPPEPPEAAGTVST